MSTSPTMRFFGGLLMAVGGLIAGVSGLCTGGFMVVFVASAVSHGVNADGIGMVFLPLAVGFLPILIGTGLFFLGRVLYRS